MENKVESLEDINDRLANSLDRINRKEYNILKYINRILESDVEDLYSVLITIKFLLEEVEWKIAV